MIRRLLLPLAVLAFTAPSAGAAGGAPASFWRDGQMVSGFDFGSRSPERDGRVFSQPVWMLTTGANARGEQPLVPGQRSIFDVNVGDPAYTDMWQVILVTVPATYQANSARSVADLVAAGYPQTATTTYLNCPFAAEGESPGSSGPPLLQGWVRGEPVSYYDFGPATSDAGTIWEFTQSTSGQQVPVAGQLPVLDTSPATFHRLVWVQVPADFAPGRFTTAAEVQASGYPMQPTEQLVNIAGLPASAAVGGQAVWVALGLLTAAFVLTAIYIVH